MSCLLTAYSLPGVLSGEVPEQLLHGIAVDKYVPGGSQAFETGNDLVVTRELEVA